MSKLNPAWEIVNSLRQSRLSEVKGAIDAVLRNADESGVDDRRKLSLSAQIDQAASLAITPAGPAGGSQGRVRYMTASEIGVMTDVLRHASEKESQSGLGLLTAALPFLPPDRRAYNALDYGAICCFRENRPADAYLIWHRAVAAPPNPRPSWAPAAASAQPKPPAGPDAARALEAKAEHKSPEADAADAADADKPDATAAGAPRELPLRRRGRDRHNPEAPAAQGSEPARGAPAAGKAGLDGKGAGVGGDSKGADSKGVGAPKGAEGGAAKGVGPAAAEAFCKADGPALQHIYENIGHALRHLRCNAPTAASLPKAEKLFEVTHEGGWTSASVPPRFHAFNPSIIRHPTERGKFLVNLRAGNYVMNSQHRYEIPADMPGITTLNFLLAIGQDSRAQNLGESRQITGANMPHPYPAIGGQEDVRLLWEPEARKLYASFTSLEATADHKPQVCLMEIEPKRGRIVRPPVRLHGFESDKPQKNWVGFADAGRLFFIYSFQPIVVLQANPKSGEVKLVSLDANPVVNKWRGSSPLIELSPAQVRELGNVSAYGPQEASDRWFLALVHGADFPRYYHQFVVLKKTDHAHSDFRPFSFQVTHQSHPFVFANYDVEFSCGAAFTEDGAELVVPFSRRDNNCTCMRFNGPHLLGQRMVPVPALGRFRP
jgi:hypothetical protein